MGCAQSVNAEKFPYAKKIDGGDNYSIYKATYSAHLLTHKDATATPYEAFLKNVKRYPDNPWLGTRVPLGNGEVGPYEWISWSHASNTIDQFASGLMKLDFVPVVEHPESIVTSKFRFIGISSRNRAEYTMLAQSCYRQGITLVPMYDTLGAEVVEYISNQTKLTTIACEGKKVIDILKCKKNIASLKNIICFEKETTAEMETLAKENDITLTTWESVCESGKANPLPAAIYDPETTVNTICYTSGTTGMPKGAVLTHGNFMAMAAALQDVFDRNQLYWTNDDIHISYLPYAHVLERVVSEKMIEAGCRIGFYRGETLKIVDDIKELKPTIFISVPRLLNRVFERVSAQLAAKTGVAKTLIAKAFAAKTNKIRDTADPTHALWDKLVFSKTKEALGGRVKLIFSGSAPMSAPVIDFLKVVFCCPFLEGYGMTETTCAGGITYFQDPESGHIGGLLGCNEMMVKDIPEMGYTSRDVDENGINCPRGEILFRGGAIFKGYFLDPERTKDVMTEDGFFHTGDVCKILPSGAIKIIDRAKNIFKLAQGEYIAAEKIENVYGQCPGVAQAFVFGYSTEAFVVGVVVPNVEEYGREWAALNGKASLTDDQIFADPAFKTDIQTQMFKKGKEQGLNSFEQVKDICLIREPFSVENDLLTPSFKLKRHIAREVFKPQIDELYKAVHAATAQK